MDIADAGREVKKELSSDEKVLESVFKLETLYKKYKFLIWTVAIGLVAYFIGSNVMKSMHEQSLEEANKAFLTLQENDSDTQALAILKEKNIALYDLFTFSKASKDEDTKTLATLENSTNKVIADLSKYTVAGLENKSSDSVLHKEMAILQEAYLAMKSGDSKSAIAKLELITENSPLAQIATLLKHSTLTAK
ncbi:MAG: Unknown protein [uncultured Sulfurovum sp.]|uniref:Tetratricopeptide repeat-like domain-containing protein n=1 Tax=uncultured Sulfurovum sp. TaxID=269237 RepID=A0A6S6SZF8_9BACT|nr:MAG: Unknown protein [uncultured Sulfurovum sp.]